MVEGEQLVIIFKKLTVLARREPETGHVPDVCGTDEYKADFLQWHLTHCNSCTHARAEGAQNRTVKLS
jgi:hypothetical protein